MTTIATDGNTMAADGLVTAGNTITDSSFVKLSRMKDGTIVGISGSAYDSAAFIDWYVSAEPDKKPPLTEDFIALVLKPDGNVLSFNQMCHWMPERVPCAVGSGMDFALAAMDCGKTPMEAVNIACNRDSSSGGVITFLTRGTSE